LTPGFGQSQRIEILGDFSEGWQKDWLERKYGGKTTVYQVVEDDTAKILKARSVEGASMMWHMLALKPGRLARIHWTWKIDDVLDKDIQERTKKGDDYAARLFVVFQPHLVNWKTNALCYVWATNEDVGSIYPNPYANNVMTIVVQSGKENRRKWIDQERDLLSDYRDAFGEVPDMITAVALMVDTDNSMENATAWFSEIRLELGMAEEDKKRRRPEIMIEY
jgi:hypothetical protein